MHSFSLSAHVKEQAIERAISLDMIEAILNNPAQILDDNKSGEDHQKIYQSLMDFPGKGTYLVRVCVNCEKQPNVVKTVYKTSKIAKYT